MSDTQIKPPVQNPPKQRTKKRSSPAGIIVFILVIAAVIGITGYTSVNGDNINDLQITSKIREVKSGTFKGLSGKKQKNNSDSPYIAKLFITGIIEKSNETYNQQWLLDTIKDLKDDPQNKGIVLFIDSPGGTVYEADEVYLALNDYQVSRKPVWAYMGSLAASGGYYISCSASQIVANRNTLTGSIGVIAGQSIDLTELMSKMGIKSKTFTAGRNKNMLNYNNPLTQEQEQIMQSVADDCYNQFTKIVAVNRTLDIERVKELADGRIYTANQALENKLIDKIDSLDNTIAQFKAKNELTDCKVIDYEYSYEPSIWDLLKGKASVFTGISKSREEVILDKISPKMTYPAYIWVN